VCFISTEVTYCRMFEPHQKPTGTDRLIKMQARFQRTDDPAARF
jgi:hypothetical protein